MQIISGKKRGLKLYPLSGKNTRPNNDKNKKRHNEYNNEFTTKKLFSW